MDFRAPLRQEEGLSTAQRRQHRQLHFTLPSKCAESLPSLCYIYAVSVSTTNMSRHQFLGSEIMTVAAGIITGT